MAKTLTGKQIRFCQAVANGSTLCDAYRAAYQAQRMSQNSVYCAASKLMAHPKITQKVEQLEAQQSRVLTALGMSDKDRVLSKLRTLLENAEGTPAETVMLRAADLLGKSVGLYRDVVETVDERTSNDIADEIQARLTAALTRAREPDEDEALH